MEDPVSPLPAIQQICDSRSELFTPEKAATEWLLELPRKELVLSPEAIGRAFLLQAAAVYAPSQTAKCSNFCFFVPSHFLPDHGLVLGTIHLRSDRETSDKMPKLYKSDLRDSIQDHRGFDATLARFVLDLPAGRLYYLSRSLDGNLTAGSLTFGSAGLTEMTVGSVASDGSLLARLCVQQMCPFCALRGPSCSLNSCSCPVAMRRRLLGSRVSLSSWSHLLQLGRSSYNASCSYAVKDAFMLEPGPLPLRNNVGFAFAADSRVLTARASYINHLTVLTLSVLAPLETPTSETPVHETEPSQSTNGTFMDIDDLTSLDVTPTDSIEVLAGEILDWSLVPGTTSSTGSQDSVPAAKRPVPGRATRTIASSGRGRRAKSPPVCPVCSKRFAKHHNMQRHIAATHVGLRQFECEQCPATFTQAGNLKRHRQTVHEHRRPFVCEHCGAEFGSLTNLTRHKACKHEK
eukprot:Plantae.Rhodophyta-Rhodochaete_pulchella.ctg10330.p1 GENE.Plantae.Rhodophyta-Rhodochaete_pulchella.ctg10330~~Plantae.Rhodophyta-Rhodochaete_pulchella.ctg10330.p1  ORF type:complete len:462 (-),score=25.33 Plantae.Rhodophyta-Rhodochaete_pulchella.ctg10330:1234-2619(-)